MFQSIWQDVQQQFRFGNKVTQIILVNIAVWIAFGILGLIFRGIPGSDFYLTALHFFSLSSDWLHNLTHPWTLLTYGFVHEGVWHLFWNLLLFYWFGRIVGDLVGDQRILPLYLWGVLAGGLLFWVTALLPPFAAEGVTRYLIGASAGVMATIVAAAFIAPEYPMRLLLIGEVRLKYVALAILLIDLFAFGTDGNTGGHFAHIGGMLMGYVFVAQLRQGKDLAEPVNRVIDGTANFFARLGGGGRSGAVRRAPAGSSRRHASVSQRAGDARRSAAAEARARADEAAVAKQDRLDGILVKIKAQGIDSLTDEERAFLSQASREDA